MMPRIGIIVLALSNVVLAGAMTVANRESVGWVAFWLVILAVNSWMIGNQARQIGIDAARAKR